MLAGQSHDYVGGSGGPGKEINRATPFAPDITVLGESIPKSGDNLGGGGGVASDAVATEQFVVSLFLTRDDLIDDHRTACSDGFLSGCATSFAHDGMVGNQ